jgi:hypothetical protein
VSIENGSNNDQRIDGSCSKSRGNKIVEFSLLIEMYVPNTTLLNTMIIVWIITMFVNFSQALV